MSDMQNFVEVPETALDLIPRLRLSLKTTLRFLIDQRWVSLCFLLTYVLLMIWDYQTVRHLPAPDAPEWTRNWPEALSALKLHMARESLGTWRAYLANLVTVLFWGNALLFIADRSEGFREFTVVGLVRYMLRGLVIALLLCVPMVAGLVLLVIPGLLVGAILMSAATIAMFREHSWWMSIAEAFRLVTRRLPGHQPVLGFSRSFLHLLGVHLLVGLISVLISVLAPFLFAVISRSGQEWAWSYFHQILVNLGSSFLSLSVSIFVLRLYAEYRTLYKSAS